MRLRIAIVILAFSIGVIESAFAAPTNAPTGVYVSLTDNPERFTVDLKTNGVYSVLATELRTNSQTGVWMWDYERHQFLLAPNTNGGTFDYQLRVLRVDLRQPETLQWIPRGGISRAVGAIDYVRFKRMDERE